MTWSPQARAAAAAARKAKGGGMPKLPAPYKHKGKGKKIKGKKNLAAAIAKSNAIIAAGNAHIAARSTPNTGFTSKPQHQVSVTGVGAPRAPKGYNRNLPGAYSGSKKGATGNAAAIKRVQSQPTKPGTGFNMAKYPKPSPGMAAQIARNKAKLKKKGK